jgi:hypothetical protein
MLAQPSLANMLERKIVGLGLLKSKPSSLPNVQTLFSFWARLQNGKMLYSKMAKQYLIIMGKGQ